jgi:hypothetical protein
VQLWPHLHPHDTLPRFTGGVVCLRLHHPQLIFIAVSQHNLFKFSMVCESNEREPWAIVYAYADAVTVLTELTNFQIGKIAPAIRRDGGQEGGRIADTDGERRSECGVRIRGGRGSRGGFGDTL